ncbi:ly6/PLAUR domain-containing protein 2 isoform X2 [Macaca nemestrina]|uniref:LY6/PLAUR domain containing 2 n=6 Tax=Cercopithecinae TaxID=9528 RepID=G7N074_MACMU|nr:ly6/PLAUR domain-containing protein 2 [Macaca fascicularis]XP_011750743.1 secreted Ly-6/uPAR-related protein 1 isoform X2 [Macaca nemestrina]XP_015001597.1 ly6/PLAUR domain-containing protein 2 [Macaca mulatta]XP_025250781.1 ly6/PLAUR domain-containing protein 2 [Theropithecus gelada]XP_050657031.1 ly6/PLAUR domain-containing protein 2 [Macaca thibetana thibetana]EHH28800.1 Ly6/PLAUR domain-containing protein 2 [Macaca mulatta]
MRGMRLALLALVLAACGELAPALHCYVCLEPTGVSDCNTIATCTMNETMCKTTLYSREIVYPFQGDSTVTKSCASKCEPSDVDGIGQTRPVSCCNTELCNVDGAPALNSPHCLAGALTLLPLLNLRL